MQVLPKESEREIELPAKTRCALLISLRIICTAFDRHRSVGGSPAGTILARFRALAKDFLQGVQSHILPSMA